METNSKKKEKRTKLLEIRRLLTNEQYSLLSERIQNRLIHSDFFIKAKVVHLYRAMKQRKEAETDTIIQTCYEQNKRVIVPVIYSKTGILTHYEVTDATEWKENAWGVPEPSGNFRKLDSALLHQIDLVVVPMVGGDRNKSRMGYGKGFYDRFLSELSAKTTKAGLLFSCCMATEIPAEPHDVPLDCIVTENELIR
ncbi:MAG: 5-formyltetrahydrofolate cyclo-ligase [Balneolales bacterium]|nr:5-formyltetrahydrofolate cyclo-ligase [Balneolales bacterium]